MLRMLLFFCVLISSVSANEDGVTAPQWLEKMQQAMKVLEYQGTVVFFKNGRLDSMKYFHAVDAGKEQERLVSLNSPMREVVREDGKVSCVFKSSKEVVINHRPVSESFIVNLPDDFTVLDTIYQFAVVGDESVVMRAAKIISIQAKDAYRYSRKIWIDKEYFLPLKIEVYDSSGKTLEQIVFNDLQIEKNVDYLKMDFHAEDNIRHVHKLASLSLDAAGFEATQIPAGFDVVFFTRMEGNDSAQMVEHLLLSDGFSSISVYTEIKASDTVEELQTLGDVNSVTRIIDELQITAMGEVPAAGVQLVAQGVKLKH